MKIINADPTRMIDLPGVGPCPRPVDIDQSVTGFNRLKSLRIYRFAPGATIEGESEEDEVYIVALDGAARMEISGAHPLSADLGPGRALYMTPHHAYRLTPAAQTHVAYSRALAAGRVATHATGAQGGAAEHLQFRVVALKGGDRLPTDPARERLVHVIAGRIAVGSDAVAAPQTVALAAGEAPSIAAEGAAEVLVVSA
jgi:5-deoxy-D-glucuronate isomerase